MKEYSYGICPYKVENNAFYILVNKSSETSFYNFFKGKTEEGETPKQTAIREFFEEAGIKLNQRNLEEYYEQKNPRKDIGIFLYDFTTLEYELKLQESEIYSAEWLKVGDDINLSKNQSKIYNHMCLDFYPRMKFFNSVDVK